MPSDDRTKKKKKKKNNYEVFPYHKNTKQIRQKKQNTKNCVCGVWSLPSLSSVLVSCFCFCRHGPCVNSKRTGKSRTARVEKMERFYTRSVSNLHTERDGKKKKKKKKNRG